MNLFKFERFRKKIKYDQKNIETLHLSKNYKGVYLKFEIHCSPYYNPKVFMIYHQQHIIVVLIFSCNTISLFINLVI